MNNFFTIKQETDIITLSHFIIGLNKLNYFKTRKKQFKLTANSDSFHTKHSKQDFPSKKTAII